MGNNALKEIDAQPGRYGNRQIVQIGRILGIVGIVLLVLGHHLGRLPGWPRGHLGRQHHVR